MKTQPSGRPATCHPATEDCSGNIHPCHEVISQNFQLALQANLDRLPPLPSKPIVLDEYELAAYWKISVKTVRRWRRELLGPAFCKVGTRSVYPLSEIEAFERRMSRNATSLRAYR